MKCLIVLFLFCVSCDRLEVSANEGLSGEWELVKVVNGFAQIEQTKSELGFEEILKIDLKNKTFQSSRSTGQTELSSLSIDKEQGQDALILNDLDIYRWYQLVEIDGQTQLVLYERCPIGAILADGSNYYYSKR